MAFFKWKRYFKRVFITLAVYITLFQVLNHVNYSDTGPEQSSETGSRQESAVAPGIPVKDAPLSPEHLSQIKHVALERKPLFEARHQLYNRKHYGNWSQNAQNRWRGFHKSAGNLRLERLRNKTALFRSYLTKERLLGSKACRIYEYDLKRIFTVYKDVLNAASKQAVNDIVLITQLSADRISSLFRLILSYTGPVSAAIYIAKDQLASTYKELQRWSDANNRKDVVIHLVLQNGYLYPVNFMRNTALKSVVADYIFLVDADFVTSRNLHDVLRQYIAEGFFENTKRVLIVPEFSYTPNVNFSLPLTKEDALVNYGKYFKPFDFGNPVYDAMRSPTDFKHWMNTNETYQVQFRRSYEPYFVIERKHVPSFDERFLARWADKMSYVLDVVNRCFNLFILAEGFIVHVDHPSVRLGDRLINDTFKCVQYLYYRDFLLELKDQNTGCFPDVIIPHSLV